MVDPKDDFWAWEPKNLWRENKNQTWGDKDLSSWSIGLFACYPSTWKHPGPWKELRWEKTDLEGFQEAMGKPMDDSIRKGHSVFIIIIIIIIMTFISMWRLGICSMVHMERPRNNFWVGSVLPPYGFQGSNSGHQAWWQVPLPAEPSCWTFLILNSRENSCEVIVSSRVLYEY